MTAQEPHLYPAFAAGARLFGDTQSLGANRPLDGNPRVADRRRKAYPVLRVFLQHSPEKILHSFTHRTNTSSR